MKKLLGIVVLGLLLSGNVYAQNLKFTKIINLDKPWGSSFISNDKIIITENIIKTLCTMVESHRSSHFLKILFMDSLSPFPSPSPDNHTC